MKKDLNESIISTYYKAMLFKKRLLLLYLILPFQLFSESEILILHSYDRSFEWTEDINRVCFETLVSHKLSYSSNTEYMDTKENDPKLVFPYLYEHDKAKYRKKINPIHYSVR